MRDPVGRSIGRLGSDRAPLDLEFTYFEDATIRVHPYASDQVEVEFMQASDSIDWEEIRSVDLTKVDSMGPDDQVRLIVTLTKAQQAGLKALMASLRQLVHPDDFERYWELGRAHGQQVRDRMADVRAITDAVLAETADFPTGRPGDSPPGPSPTPASSAAGSPSPVEWLPRDTERALALERGRPDIQEFFVMEMETRQAAERERKEAEARDHERLSAAGLG